MRLFRLSVYLTRSRKLGCAEYSESRSCRTPATRQPAPHFQIRIKYLGQSRSIHPLEAREPAHIILFKMKILLWLLLCLTLVSSEDEGPIIDIDYALNPRQLWTATASEVGENNGAFISPDGSLVVVTSSDATIRGYDAETGASLFTTQPNSLGFPVNNYGGVTFSPSRDFFVFAVVDGAPNPELTTLGARR